MVDTLMVDTIQIKHKARQYALLLTLLLSGGILLLLIFYIIHTQNPPYPEGGGGTGNGIELNLGFSAMGAGNQQDELAASQDQPEPEKARDEHEKVLTQDVEEAPSINEKVKEKPNKKVTPVPVPVKKVDKKEPEKPKQIVNPKLQYKPTGNHTTSDGPDKTPGDKGDPNGKTGASYTGNGGSNGSGGGSGGGTGKGSGTGNGPGTFQLAGRNILGKLPTPEYKSNETGTVVVEITVNKDGQVTQAVAGKQGTTIEDIDLQNAAQRAAMQAKFDRKPDAPAFQKGKIYYIFKH